MLDTWRICLFLSMGLCFLCACQPQTGSEVSSQPIAPFFDLESYFQKEADRLQQQQISINKAILLDGQQETQTLDSVNYEEELSVFIHSDINRPAWLDQYQVDSSFTGDQLTEVRYQALNDRLKTRSLAISLTNDQVVKITVENLLETVIATTRQQLSYIPTEGYSIHNKQKIALSNAQEVTIEVKFE